MIRRATALRPADVVRRRLFLQHLTGPTLTDPVAVIRELGAVQAQDFPGSKWAIAQRAANVTEPELDELFDRGAFLRTHVLRPTWHVVAPEDIRWMLALTGPRVLQKNRTMSHRLGLDGRTVARAMTILQRTMEGGRAADRATLRTALARGRIVADESQRFAYILMHAELQALVCSGPRRGKQQTHALLDERAAPAPARSRDDAVRELTRRYFQSHGPATMQDFTVWSGLTMKDARAGLDANGATFASAPMDGLTWWFPAGDVPAVRGGSARLLPNYDEYFIGFKHRSPLLERLNAHERRPSWRELLAHLIVMNGQVCGGWRRSGKGEAILTASPVVNLTAAERRAVEREVARYARFLGTSLEVRWAA
ncbi:MAG: AlkZ family DNA glycosylase [Cytophagaceae bacterium]|nr:AlkZ family DNA glycosylase [Gemmatimonadaceae bacterium]